VTRLRPLGEIDNSRRFDLAIGLPLRNREALTNLLEELYDPASPNYHKFLSPEQFTEKFGPTDDDYQAVIAFVKSNHFVLTGRHPNRLLVDVNATAADIQRALHLKLRIFQHPSEPRAFYAPDSEPSLNSRLPILSIQGLDDFSPPRPMDLHFSHASKRSGISPRRPLTEQPLFGRGFSALETQSGDVVDATGSGPSGSFIGQDFRNAYAPGVLLDGAGESVGLVALDNYYPTDVTTYEDLAGLPRVTITNVFVNGFNRAPGLNNGEVALDIQMAVSMAPGLSKVIVYVGSVPNDVLNRMATDNQARQLSSSWTFGKQVDAVREQIYQQFAAQGQTMFQSSGDAGAYGGALFAPADDPYVTAVGGTRVGRQCAGRFMVLRIGMVRQWWRNQRQLSHSRLAKDGC
jgi:subtilase family serine protease